MMLRQAHRGFTLLEVMLAIALLVGFMGGLLGFYSYATDLRQRVGEQAGDLAAKRLVMDRITTELRGANVSRFLRIGLTGKSDRMQFIAASLPGAAIWVEAKTGEDPIPREHDLRLIGYSLQIPTDDNGEPLRDEDGEIIINGLERTVQKLLTAPNVEEGETFDEVQQIQRSLLAPQFKFLSFRYWTGDTWLDSWRGGDLPLAVEVALGAEPLPEDMEIEDYLETYPTSRRVVYLPGAAMPKPGSVVNRGAAGVGGGRGER